ncbi:MAG: putative bifunctional diguanylate cyclase/phosphodiesterase [Sulfuricaulis sp.]
MIIALQMVLMGAAIWRTRSMMQEANQKLLAAHEEVTLRPLVNICQIALVTQEFEDAQNYIEQVIYKADVLQVLLVNQKNVVVASTNLTEVGKPLPPLTDSPDTYWRKRKIDVKNGPSGIIAVQFSSGVMIQALHKARTIFIALNLTGTVIIAAAGWFMGFLLTRRLNLLRKAAQRFTRGEMYKTGLQGNDEVAAVGRAFDLMAQTIQSQFVDLHESRERFSLAVSGTRDGILDWNIKSGEFYYSPRYLEILGFERNDKTLSPTIEAWTDRIHPDDAADVLKDHNVFLHSTDDFFTSEHRLRRQDGTYVWIHARASAQRDSNGEAVRMVGSITDISDRKAQELAMRNLALHDTLTRLPNRLLLNDRLRQAILVGLREKRSFGLIVMDLDRFKEINDSLGHHVGDQVLQYVSLCTRTCLRESDTVARMGGDEFAVLLATASSQDGAVAVARKIIKAVSEPFEIDGRHIEIGSSLGIAMFPEHGENPEVLLRLADVAMYKAKQSHSGYQVYSKELGHGADDQVALQDELRHAITNNELLLHYQPKIDFDAGRVSGVEALVRWQHPQLGLLFPDSFIPQAQQTGLIKPLTHWVLSAALQQIEEWQKIGLALTVSVNISAINIQDPEFPDQVAKLLAKYAVPPSRLELEITESAMMSEPVRAIKCIKELGAMGLQIAIDDFGTGYSSMAYLKKMLIAKIKIDKSFVMDMIANHNDAVIVRSTVELGHNLGLKVVAEGVESREVWDSLKALGCDSAQGYYMSHPLPSAALVQWLRQSPWGLPIANA